MVLQENSLYLLVTRSIVYKEAPPPSRAPKIKTERVLKPNTTAVHEIQDLVNRPSGNKTLQILNAFLFQDINFK